MFISTFFSLVQDETRNRVFVAWLLFTSCPSALTVETKKPVWPLKKTRYLRTHDKKFNDLYLGWSFCSVSFILMIWESSQIQRRVGFRWMPPSRKLVRERSQALLFLCIRVTFIQIFQIYSERDAFPNVCQRKQI